MISRPGLQLVADLKRHVLATMAGMPECRPAIGSGSGSALIQDLADLDLDLRAHNGWLTWSVLMALIDDGLVEVVPGTESRRRYRLL